MISQKDNKFVNLSSEPKPRQKAQALARYLLLVRQQLSLQLVIRTIESQRDRWFLWYPVAVIAGISAYFALPREPHLLVFIVAVIIATICVWVLVSSRVTLKLLLTFCLLLGFVAAKVRTDIVEPKTLLATTPTTQITGWVEGYEKKKGRRSRILLHLEKAEGIKPAALPDLVRLSGKAPAKQLYFGDRVTFRGRMFPLPTPTQPRGYDFGRKLWFEGVGATGFFYGKVIKTGKTDHGSWSFKAQLQKLRHMIAGRVIEAMPGKTGTVAVALIIGNRGAMDKTDAENLRKAGLAHILAISGLHMSLVAGGMFWLVRALLAMSGPLVLNFPIKKWAAIAGIMTGLFYLLISGASIATQRAFIMLLIMFVAILADRPAISMRNLAIAALLIAIVRPEAVLSAGFQMSFMAVVGLIGFYEITRAWRIRNGPVLNERSSLLRWTGKGSGFFLSIATTTLIASIFTGLPAAYHFNTIALFSLAGNIVALPVVSLIVMPGAILTVLLMPLGLEIIGAGVMQTGIDLVLNHAQTIAELPNAQIFMPRLEVFSAILVALGMIWLCLWRGWLKTLAIIPLAIGLLTINASQQPDILISKFGRNVAIRDQGGLLVLADNKKSRFDVGHWLVANGEGISLKQAAGRKGWRCEAKVCTASIADKKIVYLKKGAKPQKQICSGLDMIISAEPLRATCKSVLIRIDRFDLWRNGSHAIYLEQGKARVETATGYRGHRPWVQRPIARRKILINPQQFKRPYKGKKLPGGKQRAASL